MTHEQHMMVICHIWIAAFVVSGKWLCAVMAIAFLIFAKVPPIEFSWRWPWS